MPDNIEIIDIKYKGRLLKRYTGEEVAGKKWTEFQEFVGSELNLSDKVNYTIIMKDGEKHMGQMQVVNLNPQPKETSMYDDDIKKQIKSIEDKLSKAAKDSGGVPYQILLDSQKAGYEAQIRYLEMQLRDKDITIQEYKNKIEKLESEIDTYLDELDELRSKSGYGQLIEVAQKFLVTKLGSPKVTTLKESDPSDIPDEILEILGAVDYVKLKQDPVSYQKIVDTLKQYISFLPLKGNK